MARIELPGVNDVSPDVLPMWERFYTARGSVPYMFRTLSLRPEIANAVAASMHAILNTGTVPLRLKEMVAVRVSQLNGCAY
jgi:alkylhydroperoxidase family enzyme